MLCCYLQSTHVLLCLQSKHLLRDLLCHILPYLVSADLKHILDGPVNIYVSSNLKQDSNSTLCFQNLFSSESCSLSEFSRWMFIETDENVICCSENPSRGLSVHSSLPKNRTLSSVRTGARPTNTSSWYALTPSVFP